MRRRRLLGSVGTGLSAGLVGCLGATGDEELGREVVDVTADPSPDIGVEPAVSVASEATITEPAELSIAWENVGEEAIRFGEARSVVFSNTRDSEGSAQLLATDEFGDLGDAVAFDGCWRVTEDVPGDGSYETVRLAPGETHRGAPGLYARGEDCLGDGSYRFDTRVAVADPSGGSGSEVPGEWGFVVDVRTD